MDLEKFEFNQDTLLAALIIFVSYFIGRHFLPRWLAGVPYLRPEDAKAGLDEDPSALVLDVRMPHQFSGKDGHIDGALNVSLLDLMARVKTIKEDMKGYADVPVLVVCKSDQLSARAARILRKNGLNRVAVLHGGLKAWKKAGLPVTVEAPQS